MTHPLTLSLTDRQYSDLAARAAASGVSPEAYLLRLAGVVTKSNVDDPDSSAAATSDVGIRRHFGSFASGDPNAAENTRIDADLARHHSDSDVESA